MIDRMPHSFSLLYLRSSEYKSPPAARSVITYLLASQLLNTPRWRLGAAYIVCSVSNAALMGRIFG
jgi:hypothetical protein